MKAEQSARAKSDRKILKLQESIVEKNRKKEKYKKGYQRLFKRDFVMYDGKLFPLLSPNENSIEDQTVSFGFEGNMERGSSSEEGNEAGDEARDGARDGAGDETEDATNRKTCRAKRQKVFAHDEMVLRLRGNIAVREGGIGGTCCTQRNKTTGIMSTRDTRP